jgi:hypothetical protein
MNVKRLAISAGILASVAYIVVWFGIADENDLRRNVVGSLLALFVGAVGCGLVAAASVYFARFLWRLGCRWWAWVTAS